MSNTITRVADFGVSSVVSCGVWSSYRTGSSTTLSRSSDLIFNQDRDLTKSSRISAPIVYLSARDLAESLQVLLRQERYVFA